MIFPVPHSRATTPASPQVQHSNDLSLCQLCSCLMADVRTPCESVWIVLEVISQLSDSLGPVALSMCHAIEQVMAITCAQLFE